MKGHDEFFSALDRSHLDQQFIARWMVSQGFEGVRVLPAGVNTCTVHRLQCGDAGDIEIRKVIQLKHRTLAFSSVETYPFADVIVDEIYKIKRTNFRALHGYLIVNADRTGALFIPADTRAQWTKQLLYDRTEDGERGFYLCPKALTEYHAITFPTCPHCAAALPLESLPRSEGAKHETQSENV